MKVFTTIASGFQSLHLQKAPSKIFHSSYVDPYYRYLRFVELDLNQFEANFSNINETSQQTSVVKEMIGYYAMGLNLFEIVLQINCALMKY